MPRVPSHPKYGLLGNTGRCSLIIQASSRKKRAREPERPCTSPRALFYLKSSSSYSLLSGGVQLLSQSCPRLFTIASSYGLSLLLPSDLIRALCSSRSPSRKDSLGTNGNFFLKKTLFNLHSRMTLNFNILIRLYKN